MWGGWELGWRPEVKLFTGMREVTQSGKYRRRRQLSDEAGQETGN